MVVVAVLVLVGAVTIRAATRDTDCFPGQPRVSPAMAGPGDTVVVTAAAFPCDRGYHQGALYGLRFRSDGGDAVDLGSFPVGTDGSFEAEVTVPDSTAPGRAQLVVTGYDIRDVFAQVCDDGDPCAPYAATLTVT